MAGSRFGERYGLCPIQRLKCSPSAALRPWAKNARTHSRKQVKQIAESIRSFGFTNPVLIDNADTILAGHGRVEAAKLLGLWQCPVSGWST